ncbi:MAG: AEC family transporter [Clostridia bacterium]
MGLIRVLEAVLPVFMVIALGYLFGRKQWISTAAVDGMKQFVVNITLPAVLFSAFYTATYDRTILACSAVMFCACVLGLLCGWLLRKMLRGHQPMLPFLTTGFEAGMLGYALYLVLFGENQINNFAMLDFGHTLFVFTVYVGLLNGKTGKSIQTTLRSTFRSPVLLAMLLGVLVGVTGLGTRVAHSAWGGIVEAMLSFIKAPTACVILFVIGCQMRLSRSTMNRAAVSVALRVLVTACLCVVSIWAIGLLAPMTRALKFAIILMFSLPAPFILPIYVQEPEEQAVLSTALSLNTLFSIAAFAIISIFA